MNLLRFCDNAYTNTMVIDSLRLLLSEGRSSSEQSDFMLKHAYCQLPRPWEFCSMNDLAVFAAPLSD